MGYLLSQYFFLLLKELSFFFYFTENKVSLSIHSFLSLKCKYILLWESTKLSEVIQ